jgi:membrane protein
MVAKDRRISREPQAEHVFVTDSWYAGHFGSYNKTYGTLGAIVGFMVWMWISIIVVLLGAELDAKGERQVSNKT